MGILSLAPLCVTGLRLEGETLFLEAEGEDAVALCPSCGIASCRVQARYRWFPLDLPWRGFVVRLAVRARRFRCDNAACARRTFAEEFGATLGRRRRFTSVVRVILADVAAALGGLAGVRLAERQGAPASRATLLMNMETHEPIDLLEGRAADVLADWLKEHPGIEVIVRDRGGAYAEGARQGAPGASQVADRYHLTQNVSSALDAVIKSRPWALPAEDGHGEASDPGAAGGEMSAPAIPADDPPEPDPAPVTTAVDDPQPPATPLSPSKQLLAERRAARVARWRRVHELRAQGGS